jgi:hypothetical protein
LQFTKCPLFFMRIKLNTCLFRQNVDWRNPGMRLRAVLDKAYRAAASSETVTPALKDTKQQPRSSAGIGRGYSGSMIGLAVEWNLEVGSSWVWNDNQERVAKSDPTFLTRLLQEAKNLPDESDLLIEGKKVILIDMLSSTYRGFLPSVPPTSSPTRAAREKAKAPKSNPSGYPKKHDVPLRKPNLI